jgi:hypothetical protein
MSTDPLEVELLIPADQRRITVDQHQQFRESIATPPPCDPIDAAVAKPEPEVMPL